MSSQILKRLSFIGFALSAVLIGYALWHLIATEITLQQSQALWQTALAASEQVPHAADLVDNSNGPSDSDSKTSSQASGGALDATSSQQPLSLTNDLYGLFKLERLNLTLPIVTGRTEKDLEKGIVYMDQTVPPGAIGNSLLLGHRDTVFRNLKHVKLNDRFTIETREGTQTFQVVDLQIVKPDNPKIVQAYDRPVLTLVTCYPFHFIGNSPERYLVICEPVEAPSE